MSDLARTTSSLPSSLLLAICFVALPCTHAAGQSVFPEPKTPVEMTELARKYAEGIGCPRDAGRALLWHRRAANIGFAPAMVRLASMLEAGRGINLDRDQALEWYRKSAALGYGPAMTRLGDLEGNPEW